MPTLNKVTLDKKKVLVNCLEFYSNDLCHTKMQPLEKMLLTISQRLYYKWFKLINNPTPVKKSNLKLPYDEAYVLNMAILRYQRVGNTDAAEYAALELFKFELDPQLL